MKGGGFMRWYGNQEYVVNWELDGDEIRNFTDPDTGRTYSRPQNTDYYFHRGVTWSDLTSGRFSARLSPGGFIFDVKGSSAFPEDIPLVLGLLNSSFAHYMLNLLNPTVSFQVGDLARLPVPESSSDKLRVLVDEAIALARAESEEDETTWDFIAPPNWADGIEKVDARHARLGDIEREINEEVYSLYDISAEDRRAIEAELMEGNTSADDLDAGKIETAKSAWNRSELAKAWISYAVGVVMDQFQPGAKNVLGRGRFESTTAERLRGLRDADGLLVVDPTHSDDLAAEVFAALEVMFGEAGATELVNEALGNNGEPLERLRKHLADKFFKDHIQKYRKRPIYWYLRSGKGNYGLWLYYHRLDKDILFKALLNYVEPKIRLEQDRLNTLRGRKEAAGSSGREAKQLEKEIDRQRSEEHTSELQSH